MSSNDGSGQIKQDFNIVATGQHTVLGLIRQAVELPVALASRLHGVQGAKGGDLVETDLLCDRSKSFIN